MNGLASNEHDSGIPPATNSSKFSNCNCNSSWRQDSMQFRKHCRHQFCWPSLHEMPCQCKRLQALRFLFPIMNWSKMQAALNLDISGRNQDCHDSFSLPFALSDDRKVSSADRSNQLEQNENANRHCKSVECFSKNIKQSSVEKSTASKGFTSSS